MTAELTVLIMAGIGAVGIMIDSLETLGARTSLSESGIFAPRVVRTGRGLTAAMSRTRAFCWVFGYPSVLVIPSVQIVAALAVLLAALSNLGGHRLVITGIGAGVIVVARMLFYGRNVFGQDGSDQMFLIVFVTVCAASLLHSAATIAICFAAAEVIVCYTTSGVAKLISPVWRNGTAVVRITGTLTYGDPRISRFLSSHRPVAWLCCWTVIVFESSAFLWLLGGHQGALAYVAIAVAFHVGVAFAMGLNIFFWSFTAALPSYVFLAYFAEASNVLPFLR